jgi:hypothetical protein
MHSGMHISNLKKAKKWEIFKKKLKNTVQKHHSKNVSYPSFGTF